MARFDLSKYATVAERIQLLYSEYPDALIITKNLTKQHDREKGIWVVKAELWLPMPDGKENYSKHPNHYLKATGHAFEVDGGQGANLTSALENAESSAVGRCLALAGWSANKEATTLASREEMQKVERGNPEPERNWSNEASLLSFANDKPGLLALYAEAQAKNVAADVLAEIVEYGQKVK